jgi:hypothetical protein
MVELARRVRMRVPAAGAAVVLAVAVLAGCGGSGSGGSGSGSGSGGSGPGGSTSGSTSATGTTTTTTSPPPHSGSLTVSPAAPTPGSEITFSFTAPVSTGVHGTHEISYSLSVVGPDRGGCVNAHEAGSPSVTRGAQGQITLGPSELQERWCTGMYEARLLELSSAHCTGSAPCPQYVRVAGIIGRAMFTVRRG